MWWLTLLACCFTAYISLCLCAPQDGYAFNNEGEDSPSNRNKTGQSIPRLAFPSSGKSAEMCKKYGEFVFNKELGLEGEMVVDQCALSVEPRITGSDLAQPREFPHMALIGYPRSNKNGKKWICGGSLISERFVLSAAHCNSYNKVSPKWVRLGDYNYKTTEDDNETAKPVEFDIIEIISHPEYDVQRRYNDITLYKLDRDVEFNEYVRPICLHTEYQLPRSYYTVTGWGHVESGLQSDGVLRKGNITYVPGNECQQLLKPAFEQMGAEFRDDSMLCPANFADGTSACQGDSGGPMQYLLENPYCMYSQVGVISWGPICGQQYPAVYTRVSYFAYWIERNVWA